jgi:hypothetical protein
MPVADDLQRAVDRNSTGPVNRIDKRALPGVDRSGVSFPIAETRRPEMEAARWSFT